jgi:uroporphyrinogen-III synthase
VNCADLVVYDQQAQPLTDAALRRLAANGPVVVPLFSPRTAKLFSAAGPFAAPLHLIAMSDAVAEAAGLIDATSITVAAEPTQPAMVAATASALRAAMDPGR